MTDLLFDRRRSFLAVIDVQPVFLDKLGAEAGAALAARIAWLIGVARALGVPRLAVAEDIVRNGPPHEAVRQALGATTPVHDKRVFGLAGQPGLCAAARALGRDQAVLVGLETDVCIAQSALGLAAAGFRVAVPADATGAAGADHAAGLERMRGAGITVTRIKGLFYEWVRDLDTLAALRERIGAQPPAGLDL